MKTAEKDSPQAFDSTLVPALQLETGPGAAGGGGAGGRVLH